MTDLFEILFDKYALHEIVEMLECVYDNDLMVADLSGCITEQFSETGVFHEEWRQLYGTDSE